MQTKPSDNSSTVLEQGTLTHQSTGKHQGNSGSVPTCLKKNVDCFKPQNNSSETKPIMVSSFKLGPQHFVVFQDEVHVLYADNGVA